MNKINFFQKTFLNIFSFLTTVFSLIVLPLIFLIRVIQKKDVTSWKIKFGNYKLPDNFDKSKKTIMIHGVSVGEVVSLEKLIRKIKENFPNHNLIITTGTKTGQETAIKKMNDIADFITYFPIDIPYAVNKFLNKINPDVVLIAETEIWPIFAYGCYKKNIPLFIINGRMSDESYKAYKTLKFFFKCILPLYKGIYTQSETDRKRLASVGARKETLGVMKNLKFDIEKFNVDIDLKKGNSKIFIAGSTHKGEDEIAIRAFKKLKEQKDIKLLLAPRHITRCDDIEKLLKKENLSYNLYSKNPSFEGVDVLMLNVIGELAKLYSTVDVAYIGGSFNQTGGHNPLEASIFNKPVVSGPSIKNFRDIYGILKENSSAFVVKNEKEFQEILSKLFFDEEFYNKTVKNTENVFNDQKGALQFVIEKLKEVI